MTAAQTNVAIGLLRDFVLTAGGSISAAFAATTNLQTGTVSFPGWAAITLACITGLVAAVARAQSKVEGPVSERGMRVRTPEQLAEQVKAREEMIALVVERVLKARLPAVAVTPDRVPAVNTNVVPPAGVSGPGVTRVPREQDLPGGTA